jgi:hypothetical protein
VYPWIKVKKPFSPIVRASDGGFPEPMKERLRLYVEENFHDA